MLTVNFDNALRLNTEDFLRIFVISN